MARKYFGTDGIRGTTNVSTMTAAMAMKVTKARVARRLALARSAVAAIPVISSEVTRGTIVICNAWSQIVPIG